MFINLLKWKICEYMKLVLHKGRTLGAVSQSRASP